MMEDAGIAGSAISPRRYRGRHLTRKQVGVEQLLNS